MSKIDAQSISFSVSEFASNMKRNIYRAFDVAEKAVFMPDQVCNLGQAEKSVQDKAFECAISIPVQGVMNVVLSPYHAAQKIESIVSGGELEKAAEAEQALQKFTDEMRAADNRELESFSIRHETNY